MSGHDDGTVLRWHVSNNELIGNSMSAHTKEVRCVAVIGNLIVSGSDNGLLHRRNAATVESIGSSLQGHRGKVTCVEVSAYGKLIVSGSKDGTIRRWMPLAETLLVLFREYITKEREAWR